MSVKAATLGLRACHTTLTLFRVIIAAYFLAFATALFHDPVGPTLFDPFLPHDQAILATIVYISLTAGAVMLGIAVRPAVLCLATYVFWSGFLHHSVGTAEAMAVYWRDMALLGSLLLIAIIHPRKLRLASEAPAPAPAPAAAPAPLRGI